MKGALYSFALLIALPLFAADRLVIYVGNQANDRTGDGFDTAMRKANTNFQTLFQAAGDLSLITDQAAARAAIRATTHVETLANLLSLTGSARTNVIIVLGRDSVGDRAGGFFYWNPTSQASTNLGTVYSPLGDWSTGRWERAWSGPVRANWFGADRLGIADSITGLQAASDFVIMSGEDGTLIMPAGCYNTSAPWEITSGISIVGEGMIGLSSLDPLASRGTTIRYLGTTDEALAVTTGLGSYVYRVHITQLRVATDGQSPKPNGIRLEMASECKLADVQFNGGFADGLVLKNVTLSEFRNLHAAANEVGVLIEDDASGGYLQDCLFGHMNLFIHSTAAVKIGGSVRNLTFNDRPWLENQPDGWLISPASGIPAIAVDNLVIENGTVNVGDSATYPDSRSIRIAGAVTNGIPANGMKLRDCTFYNNGAKHAIAIALTNNASALTTAYGIEIESCKGYGLTTSLVTNDWQNTEIRYSGSIWVFSGFGAGTLKPHHTGLGKVHNDLTKFDYRDFSGGQIWRLPDQSPSTFLDGHFGYSTNAHRPWWYDGSTVWYTATADANGNVIMGTDYVQWASGHTLSTFGNNLYLSGTNQIALVLLDPSSRSATIQLDGSGHTQIVSSSGKDISLRPNGAASTGSVNIDGTLYLRDGTYRAVTFGASDSGGSGYRLLRITN